MTLQLTPTLEMDLENVAVLDAQFYQALIGCDLLQGKAGVLGPATIQMGMGNRAGTIQWHHKKGQSIAIANFLGLIP